MQTGMKHAQTYVLLVEFTTIRLALSLFIQFAHIYAALKGLNAFWCTFAFESTTDKMLGYASGGLYIAAI